MSDVDVVIVGGGISGLSAARALCRQGFQVRLLEREAQCGGVIQTRRVGNCVLDVGPDTLLGHKPAAIALCKVLASRINSSRQALRARRSCSGAGSCSRCRKHRCSGCPPAGRP